MTDIFYCLSAERNISDESDEDLLKNIDEKEQRNLNKNENNEEVVDNCETIDHLQEINQELDDMMDDTYIQQEIPPKEGNEFIQAEHILDESFPPIQNTPTSQFNQINFNNNPPKLFQNNEGLAPFGNKQQVVSFQIMKQQQIKPLPKWSVQKKKQTSQKKIPELKENIRPNKLKDQPRNNSQKQRLEQNKYARANLGQSIDESYRRLKDIPAKSRNQKSRERVSNFLFIFNQISKGLTQEILRNSVSSISHKCIKCNYNFREQPKAKMKIEDNSLISDLIDLDLSSLINQINEKKLFLIKKMKGTQQQQTTQDNFQKQVRGGKIVRNVHKPITLQVQQQKDVCLIDLYQSMLGQNKRQKNAKNRSSSVHHEDISKQTDFPAMNLQTISPKLQQRRREPGKIARINNSSRKNDNNNQSLMMLEQKYNTVIQYAQDVQNEIKNFKNGQNNMQFESI